MAPKLLLCLLAIFILLGLAYSTSTPIFETPDELQHYATAHYFARFASFPPLGKIGQYLWEQEAVQPPLYYWITAAATFWVEPSDLDRQAILQPKANIGDPALPGKKNAFLHPPSQSFPYHGTTLAVHIGRWLSVLFGAGTIALTYTAARFTFIELAAGDSPSRITYHAKSPRSMQGVSRFTSDAFWLPLLSASLLAFLPQFLFIHASFSNDSLITFTSALTLVLLLWMARQGVTRRRAALLGFAIGLMALSKLTGSVLAIVALFLMLVLARRFDLFAISGGIAAALSGWWFVRNQLLYGDPLALASFMKMFGSDFEIPHLSLTSLRDLSRYTLFSTWGLFGQTSVLMQPTEIYAVFNSIAILGMIGVVIGVGEALVYTARRGGVLLAAKTFAQENRALVILLGWSGAVAVLGARWFLAAGLQGRLLFPGFPAAVILLVYGLRSLLPRVSSRTLAFVLGLPALGLAVAVIPAYLIPAYAPPPLVKDIAPGAVPVGSTFGEEIKLCAYQVTQAGDELRLTFYWEALRAPAVDYTVAVRLVQPDGSFWLDYVNYPGMGTSLPTTWKPGEIRRDEYRFDLDRFSPAPESLRLIVGYFDPRVRDMTPVSDWPDVREPGWATLQIVKLNRP